MAKSPRMVPGAEASGLVAPRRARGELSDMFAKEEGWAGLLRPVLTASRPSQTMAQIGPEFMSIGCQIYFVVDRLVLDIHSTRPAKNGLEERSESTELLAMHSSGGIWYIQCSSR
jgi:hypothetical protein